jgi:signal transduction histidine kinase
MDYPLPKRALLASFLVSLIFPLLIFLFLSPLIDRAMVAESTEEAYRVADYLGKHLGLNREKLAPGAHDDRLQREINYISESLGLYGACIVASDGRIAYSTEETKVGHRAVPGVLGEVLKKGRRHASFISEGNISPEGFPAEGSMVEAYVPVQEGGRVIGAIAVHYDVSGVHGEMGRIKSIFALMLFVLSFGVLVLLSFYLLREERLQKLKARAEDELAQEQIKAETVFSSMGDNIIIQDRDYRVVYQNAVNREVYGDRKGEYCYSVYEGIDHVCPDCPVELTYRDGGIHKVEKEVATQAGPVNLEITASPLKNSAGEIVAGIKVVRDITEKRRLEDQLRHAQKMEAIGTLTSGISHEFNNLLTSIIGFSELLLEMVSDAEQRRYLEAIYSSGKRAEQLTRGLLAYSRKQIADRKQVSLNAIVSDLLPLLENITGIDISLRIGFSREEVVITADRSQMEQVIINIISNARDAMEGRGEIAIATARVVVDAEFADRHGLGNKGDSLCMLSIKDNGPGMDSDTVERIFEPFFTTKDVGKGTGLGLSIAYGIVVQHGGALDVISAPGQGTEFRIYLI